MKLSNETKIGIIVLIVLGLFIWGLNFLKGLDMLKRTRTYYAVYSSIRGLTGASPITVNGMRVGQIEKISFLYDSKQSILVKLAIQKRFKLTQGSIARIYNADIMGTKAIEIIPNDTNVYLKVNDTLLSDIEIELKEQISRELSPIIDKVDILLAGLDSIVLEALHKDNRRYISRSITNLYLTTQMIQEEKERIRDILANIESVTQMLKAYNDEMDKIMSSTANLTAAINKSDLVPAINKANEALTEVHNILAKIDSGKGTLGLLVNNDSLYWHLDSASKSLDLLLKDLKNSPKKYVHFSLFGRKEKSKK